MMVTKLRRRIGTGLGQVMSEVPVYMITPKIDTLPGENFPKKRQNGG